MATNLGLRKCSTCMQGIPIQQSLLLWPATFTWLPIYFSKLLLRREWLGLQLQTRSTIIFTCFLCLLFILQFWNRSPHVRILHELNPHLRSPPRAGGILHELNPHSPSPPRAAVDTAGVIFSPAFSFLFHFSNIKKIVFWTIFGFSNTRNGEQKTNFLGFVRVEEYWQT